MALTGARWGTALLTLQVANNSREQKIWIRKDSKVPATWDILDVNRNKVRIDNSDTVAESDKSSLIIVMRHFTSINAMSARHFPENAFSLHHHSRGFQLIGGGKFPSVHLLCQHNSPPISGAMWSGELWRSSRRGHSFGNGPGTTTAPCPLCCRLQLQTRNDINSSFHFLDVFGSIHLCSFSHSTRQPSAATIHCATLPQGIAALPFLPDTAGLQQLVRPPIGLPPCSFPDRSAI